MGGLVKKRNRGDYEDVDEEIQFSKRPRRLEQKSTRKTRRNSYESSDDSSSDNSDVFSSR